MFEYFILMYMKLKLALKIHNKVKIKGSFIMFKQTYNLFSLKLKLKTKYQFNLKYNTF